MVAPNKPITRNEIKRLIRANKKLTSNSSGGSTGGGGGSGSVTSVGIVGTDGIEVDSGSPITSAGDITLGLDATTLAAIADAQTALQPGADADQIDYDNTTSGLTATDVQEAIDEVLAGIGSFASFVVTDTGTGSSQNITLPIADLNESNVLVSVNGIVFESSEYSISGTDLTLTTNAPGDSIEVRGPIGGVANTSTLVHSVFSRTGDVVAEASDYDADQIDYDNGSSGLAATNVQDAIDEVVAAGGGAWELIEARTVSSSQEDFINLDGYTELLIIGRALTLSASAGRDIRLSTDNGSSFFAGASDYIRITNAGVESTASSAQGHDTGNASARTVTFQIYGTNVSGAPKFIRAQPTSAKEQLFVGSTSPINAVRVLSLTANLTGGTIYVYGR